VTPPNAAALNLDNSAFLQSLEMQQKTLLEQQTKFMALLAKHISNLFKLRLQPATNATNHTTPSPRQAAIFPVSATPVRRTSATMRTTSATYWRRIATSVLLGTYPKNRIQRGPLVIYMIVYLTIWLQQTNIVVVCHAHVLNF
jgi:hypothetical protein